LTARVADATARLRSNHEMAAPIASLGNPSMSANTTWGTMIGSNKMGRNVSQWTSKLRSRITAINIASFRLSGLR
jgi:hypothetical protein